MNINKLILGTAQLGLDGYGINNSSGKPSRQKAFEILETAQKAGIAYLDTAMAYGDSQEIIGKYHAQAETKFRVISKFHASTDVQKALIDHRTALNIKAFDTILFHKLADLNDDMYAQVLSLKAAGVLKKIGVSIYSNDDFEWVFNSEFKIDIVQFPYNMLDNFSLRGASIMKAQQLGIELHTRSVFLQGLFFMNPADLPPKLTPLAKYLAQIHAICKNYKTEVRDLALQYVLTNKNIQKVLFGAETADQLKENIHSAKTIVNQRALDLVNEIHVKEIELLNPVNWK